ncbi:MAG: tetratricopeptide repeat protein [Deltaproteobacteria bacterium]|nr:tetratricopeptide repeat protein [Deltaproteobacteria bacterium]
MARWFPNRPRSCASFAAPVLLFLLVSVPYPAAAGRFPGYSDEVRAQAETVVDAALPGKEETLEREVRSLRRLMFDHGILSINEIPDRIFERAAREGWKRRAGSVLRPVTRVAPYSVPLWAWLLREDIPDLALDRVLEDFSGLEGSLRQFGPGLLGYAAWLLLFFSASACWFAVWSSISLFLRARPSLASDISRIFSRFPRPDAWASAATLCCFVAPLVSGAGLAVAAVFWIMLSAAYLRRRELVIASVTIILLSGVYVAGGLFRSISGVSGEAGRGGWLGVEGYAPAAWPESNPSPDNPFSGPGWEAMIGYSRARAEMQSGNPSQAEAMWTNLLPMGGDLPGVYNNRGIVRARLGRTEEALADFEAAITFTPGGGPAHWNAYQLYLREFRLEQAGKIQAAAWSSLREMKPFDFRAEEMTRGELVASPLRVGDVWRSMFAHRGAWFSSGRENPFLPRFFTPLPSSWIPLFLAAGLFWATLWKLLSRKIWMHNTCRACGSRSLIVGSRETTDICNACRAQVGAGVRPGEERERRLFGIGMHRRFVRACSVLVPGAGALWAGKELRAMIFGGILSTPLGAFTVSIGAGRMNHALITDMQTSVTVAAAAATVIVWVIGAVWGWRSFDALQGKFNVAIEGK